MARHLFISQQTLTTWMDQDKVEFEDNIMTIKADGRCFKLVEAVRFLKIEGGEEDQAGLLGRVKTVQQLESMGAERYRDSVIFQDVAYQVQEGFIGEIFLKQESAKAPRPIRHARTRPELPKTPVSGPLPAREKSDSAAQKDEPSDEELLVRFLLNNTPK